MKKDKRTDVEFNDLASIEKHEYLFDEVAGLTPTWEILRRSFFNWHLENIGLNQPRPHQKRPSINLSFLTKEVLKKFKSMFISIYHSINFLFYTKSYEFILVGPGLSRMKLEQGNLIDPYLSQIIQRIGSTECLLIEPSDGLENYRKKIKHENFYFSSSINLSTKIALKIGLLEREVNQLIESWHQIKNKLSLYYVDIEFFEPIARINIQNFVVNKASYKRCMKIFKTKAIFIVTSYGKEGIVAACQELGIDCVEVQHGIVSPYDPAYIYEGSSKKLFFPHYFLSYSHYFSSLIKKSNVNTKVVQVGNPSLKLKLCNGKLTKKKKILVLSQWTVRDDLIFFTLDLSKAWSENFQIVFRLHPQETHLLQEVTNRFYGSRVVVEQCSSRSLHYTQLESEYQIGVYSTSIFEGLALGCKTFILDIAGSEHVAPLIKNDAVKLLRNVSDFCPYEKCKNMNSDEFMLPIQLDVLDAFINEIKTKNS